VAALAGNCAIIKSPATGQAAGLCWSFGPITCRPVKRCLYAACRPGVLRQDQRRVDQQDADQQPVLSVQMTGLTVVPIAVEWAPDPVWHLAADRRQPQGPSLPQSPTLNISPQSWYFVK
jgi:hypothetical protein